jgi:MerR family Zn(II)-responsive transcriptional regulator of zntA
MVADEGFLPGRMLERAGAPELGMTLGVAEVARAAGVSPHTVRYYVARGLLRAKKDARSGYHRFTTADARTLAFIRRAQALGFALREIETIIAMSRRHQSPCPVVRDIVRQRIGEFSAQLAELDETCRRMRGALRSWRRMPDTVPDGDEICRLIESVGTHGLTFEPLESRASRSPMPRRRIRGG